MDLEKGDADSGWSSAAACWSTCGGDAATIAAIASGRGGSRGALYADDDERELLNAAHFELLDDEPDAIGDGPLEDDGARTGLVLSLHWLVVSFFALSFAFQFAAAVFDLTRRSRRRRHRRVLIGDTSEEVARADDTRDAGVLESVVSFFLLPHGQLE